MPRSAPFGSWSSPITATSIVSGVKGFAALTSNSRELFWLESRPDEAGRVTLMSLGERARELTPAPYNVRSRVHEYGGGAYHANDKWAFFVDFADQDVHEIDLRSGAIRRVTATGSRHRYADFVRDAPRNRLIAIAEHHDDRAAEPVNRLIAIDLDNGGEAVLHEGHDFYASPRVSPDGDRLCFVSWDHPNMPWDGTQLHVGRVAPDGALVDLGIVAGGARESVVEPRWLPDGALAFVSDSNGWWNLHVYDESGIYCVREEPAEYADPPWGFGASTYVHSAGRHLVCRSVCDGEQSLSLVDVDQGFQSPIDTCWQSFDALTMHRGRLCFIGRAAERRQAIVSRDLASGDETTLDVAGPLQLDAALISRAESIRFPTTDGAAAHAFYYPPNNPDWVGPLGERPPLLVMSHGGPTAAADRCLNLRVQYYTSRGWAVVDVNYGGSSGFGRAYRDRLIGQWGIVDVADCVAAVDHLAAAGRVDPARVAIRGGSAGGYTTLAALTFTERFHAGASHFGIGDLEALARDTHKFESRYMDSLVGPYPEARDVYIARSPVHHVDRLRCPVVFFQGLEDRVVPPNQAEAMVAALREKGIPVAYLPFPGEQHGFRDAENIRRAIEAEYLFFATVFRFSPAETLPPIEIENS